MLRRSVPGMLRRGVMRNLSAGCRCFGRHSTCARGVFLNAVITVIVVSANALDHGQAGACPECARVPGLTIGFAFWLALVQVSEPEHDQVSVPALFLPPRLACRSCEQGVASAGDAARVVGGGSHQSEL